ncbi:MAG TPA: cell division protein ZapA [Pyrinomonadaceae bacterium]|jgi:cell division protein ZapA|nr:cell division protein ZapA [Pyrinomonadaceae bacterium]
MTTGIGQILEKSSMETTTTAPPIIRVEIYNQTYNIRSDGDSEYLMQLADFVDSRMREISSGTLTVDSLKVAILAALHIADEFHRLKQTHEQADAQLATRSAECAEMLDKLLKVRSNIEQEKGDPEKISLT